MKTANNFIINLTACLFMTVVWLIFSTNLIAADYVTALNNELAAFGLNNGIWLYNSEADKNLQNKITYNNQCNPCSKTPSAGNLSYFDNACRIEANFLATGRPWDGLINISVDNLSIDDKVLLVFWTKGDPSSDVNAGALQVYAKRKSPLKSIAAVLPMTNNWQQWRIPIEAQLTEIDIKLRFGLLSQKFEIGGIALIKYNNAANVEAARMDASQSYEGMQANAAWRTEALNRINSHRKSDINIVVKDGNGNPISNATVLVEQQAHQFDFGVGQLGKLLVPAPDVSQKVADSTRSLILKNCNMLSLGSDLLWENYINPKGFNISQTGLTEIVNWAKRNNLRFRWHNTLWPGIIGGNGNNKDDAKYIPKNISDIIRFQKDKTAFLNEVYNFVDDIVRHPNGLGNLITEIDVINEPAFNRFIEDNLSFAEAKSIYRELAIYLKENYPSKKLYINEYVVLDAGGYGNLGNSRLKDIITSVNTQNGVYQKNIDAIGFQMHTKYAVPPLTIKSLLDSYADTNTNANDLVDELKITEFDLHGIHPDIRAQYLEDFMIMIFSHPKVNGFVFWDGINDGNPTYFDFATPLYDENYNLKDSGISYKNLVFNDWWTNATRQTDACGFVSIPAFKGKQKITASYGSESETVEVDLSTDKNIEMVLNENVQDICTPPSSSCNIIKNGNFIDDSNWSDYISNTASANWNTGGGQVNYYVTNGNTNDYKVQLLQTGLNFQQNKTYLIQFEAKADLTKQIYCKLSTNNESIEYDRHDIEISRDWQVYSFYFTMQDASVNNGRVSFGIGGNNININFDNITMEAIDCGPNCDELVKNGTFVNNKGHFDLLVLGGAQANWYHNESGKYASIKIQNGADKRWKVQLVQRDLSLKNNTTYRLKFKTRADASKTIYVGISNENDTNSYMPPEYIDISDVWEEHEFTFTMNEPGDNVARLNFAIGFNNIAIRFDDISLLELDCFQANCYQNLIHFGAIQNGIYQADEYIQSTGKVDVNAQAVEYRANSKIELDNGFSTKPNTSFNAFINACE